uniref:Uncharacterized protein n=1 Tax=Salix viminalis TaxID=40686 RepID=A0A6N2M0U6_SALVM
MRKGAKRKRSQKDNNEDEAAAVPAQDNRKTTELTKPPTRAKPVKASKPEPEYYEDKRNLEDLWKDIFPVGTEWDQLDKVYGFNWNFSNLENAFEEGGVLHGKKVYLFGCTEPQLVTFKDDSLLIHIPAVVAVPSPFPPSDKIGIKSVQREVEEIIPMKQMKMDWVPYIPLENRFLVTRTNCSLVSLLLLIFIFCEFDWELDELEEFTDKLIQEDELSEDQKDAFKEFVKEKVRETKKANREAREARRKALEEMSEETKRAFEVLRFYKFYPVQTPDTPDISNVKASFINRYYGKAHEVL